MIIRKIGQRAAITAAATVLAAGGAIAFAGPAFADIGHDCCNSRGHDGHRGHHGHHGHDGRHVDDHRSNGGDGGNGGHANANCLLPLGLSAGILGQGGPISQCNSTSGSGGDAGDGAG